MLELVLTACVPYCESTDSSQMDDKGGQWERKLFPLPAVT